MDERMMGGWMNTRIDEGIARWTIQPVHQLGGVWLLSNPSKMHSLARSVGSLPRLKTLKGFVSKNENLGWFAEASFDARMKTWMGFCDTIMKPCREVAMM